MSDNHGTQFSSPENGGRCKKRISVPYFWQGGASGAEHDWNEPMNWYNRFAPGWFDVVVIPALIDCNFYPPHVNEFSNDIAQLIIEKGARLTIGIQGKLSVDGLAKKGLGIYNEGEIIIEGELTIHRTLYASVRNKGLIYNSGSFAIDKDEKRGIIHSNSGRFENLGEFLFL